MHELLKNLDAAAFSRGGGVVGQLDRSMAMRLYTTLGLFKKSGISVAALDMSNPSNPTRVWFDPDPNNGTVTRLDSCLQNGRIYLWFDDYRFAGMIALTVQKRWILRVKLFTPYFAVPHSPVVPGPPTGDYETALEWIEYFVGAGKAALSDIMAGREVVFLSP